MALPVPNLDDRRFQDLVDDAKRLVQQRCPEWTDHNVSDPGVTLIEAFAYMTDQLLYRLNRVPGPPLRQVPGADRRAAVPADRGPGGRHVLPDRAPAGHGPDRGRHAGRRRSAPRPTRRSSSPRIDDLRDRAVLASHGSRSTIDGTTVPRPDRAAREGRGSFEAFSQVPKPGDALLVGLTEAVPSCAVSLRFSCRSRASASIRRSRRSPGRPGRATDWDRLRGRVATRPAGSTATATSSSTCPRGARGLADRPSSGPAGCGRGSSSPGGPCRRTRASPADPRHHRGDDRRHRGRGQRGGRGATTELVGECAEGVPGQRFAAPAQPGRARRPAAGARRSATATAGSSGQQVADFAASGPDDRHFVLDAVAGEVDARARRAPSRRRRSASTGRCRRRAPACASTSTCTGGGRRGNVAARRDQRAEVVDPVRRPRREPASRRAGGVDGEDIENAKVRGPISLRTRGRAVTTEDYEQIVREAAPEVARVRAVAAGARRRRRAPSGCSSSRAAADEARAAPLRAARARPSDTLARVTARLDECRVIGARVVVEPPVYRGITVVAKLQPRATAVNPTRLQAEALPRAVRATSTRSPAAPTAPAGRSAVRSRSARSTRCSRACRGTELVEDVRLFGADPITGQRGQRPNASTSSRTRSSSRTSTRSWWRAPDARPGARARLAAPARRDAAGPLPGRRPSPSGWSPRWTRSSRPVFASLDASTRTSTRLTPPRTSWTGWPAGSASPSTTRGPSSAGGRSSRPRSSCTGCAGRPAGWPPRSRSTAAARSRSWSPARPAGRRRRMRRCPGSAVPASSCG